MIVRITYDLILCRRSFVRINGRTYFEKFKGFLYVFIDIVSAFLYNKGIPGRRPTPLFLGGLL